MTHARARRFLGRWLVYTAALTIAWVIVMLVLAATFTYTNVAFAACLFGGFTARLAWRRSPR